MPQFFFYQSKLGLLKITFDQNYISGLSFSDHRDPCIQISPCSLVQRTIQQIDEYLQGRRKQFCLPLLPSGTEFQKKVWQTLQKIPYGKTATYKEIATQIGNPNASRAVGMANHKNPIAILIPCHRVIQSNGKTGGYAGGLEIKKKLLELENESY